jgi:hypothetical protein
MINKESRDTLLLASQNHEKLKARRHKDTGFPWRVEQAVLGGLNQPPSLQADAPETAFRATTDITTPVLKSGKSRHAFIVPQPRIS